MNPVYQEYLDFLQSEADIKTLNLYIPKSTVFHHLKSLFYNITNCIENLHLNIHYCQVYKCQIHKVQM